MISEFIERFEQNKAALRKKLARRHPDNYRALVKMVIKSITSDECPLDPQRIHEIDDGEYQGMLVYVIGEKRYQPRAYWYVLIEYGSCSVCDTLEGIKEISHDDKPNSQQIDDYMTLALHIVQAIKKMEDDDPDS